MAESDFVVPETWITSVEVEGLHNRLSFTVALRAGVNIIYGKNGIGKTTLLHVIANLSEGDVARFSFLRFNRIEVTNNHGQTIKLVKSDSSLTVYIDDQETSYQHGINDLSEAEQQAIRAALGNRATYLPAFRSVLERMRESAYAAQEDRGRPEYEALRRSEWEAIQTEKGYDRAMRREGNLLESNVSKTLRCREWFGHFVPVIRYPSITDVVAGLSDEWTTAQIAINRIEQKQFETAFVEIFSAIAKGDIATEDLDHGPLLEEIRDLVTLDDSPFQGPTKMSAYLQLVNIADSPSNAGRNYGNVLQIYRDKLFERKVERENALKSVNAFQDSVNVFLSTKSFCIGNRSSFRTKLRERSVFIEPEQGKPYGVMALSSGERQIVTMLFSATRSLFRGGCCLIDEPELSLHVDWQRIILKQIEGQHRGRQIIACTHSPEIGADHEDRVQFFLNRELFRRVTMIAMS